MTRRRFGLVVATVLAAGAAASPGVPAKTSRPDACKLLKQALKGETYAITKLRVRPDPGATWLRCDYSDGKPPSTRLWHVSFELHRYAAASAAKAFWQAVFDTFRQSKANTPTRLRGYGPDNAFSVEHAFQSASPPPITSAAWWQKGRYARSVDITAPLASGRGDIEDVELLLRDLMRLLPSA